ncbi:conjugal transfer protein TraF [Flexistipes sinusarabici]|uniref:conjugal transfer protein TraF n=1 Tax=Flexistipes sinusarabici TaxID=2352 RepID=UPI0023562309|nr:conjugal transfer protein TraF [Flexistipes sinusarabici]
MKKICVLLILILPTFIYAAEYPYFMKSTKALGMGNAHYTISSDQYSAFYNPAGLAFNKDSRIDILNPQFDMGKNAMDFYRDAKDTDWESESEIAKLIRDNIGEHQHAGLSLFPAYYNKNFMIGVFGNARLNAVPRNKVYPNIETEFFVDRGITAGFAGKFLNNNSLSLGANVKLIERESLVETYTAADLAKDDFDQIVEDDLESGTGILGDIGAIYEMKSLPMNPRLGAAVNNIGATDFGDAEDMKTTLTLSASISPQILFFESDIVIDYVDVTKAYDQDDDLGKRIHVGAELRPSKLQFFSLRAGINQGYPTFGASLDFNILKIDYAYYTEEVGAYAGQWDDERHMLQITLGF